MPTQTLTSKTYILGLTKEKVTQSIFKLFMNRIANIVTYPRSPVKSKWMFPAFPNIDVENTDSYPIMVINSPELDWTKFTLTKKKVEASITVNIYSSAQDELDDLSDQTITAVETSIGTYRDINLRFVNLEGTDTDHIMRGEISVHIKSITFTCSFTFTKTL